MTIQPINEHDIALFIGKSDLEELGLAPDALDINDARQMASKAFVSAGLECGANLEIEAFATSCGLLVFARNTSPAKGLWLFESLDEMIDALCALGDPGCEAGVIYYEGKWYISTPTARAADVLDEYGKRQQVRSAFYEHLREHGNIILDNALTGTVRSYFA